MLTIRKSTYVFFAVILSLLCSACQHNPNLTTAQQTQVNLYSALDVITSANKSVTQSMIALNQAGTVNEATTRAVLAYNQQINDAGRAALIALDSTQSPTAKAQAVIDLLKKLDLPPPVAQFVNSNPAVASVLAVVKSIASIQAAITQITTAPVSTLSVAKVTP
jgi:hypothetical protein